MVGKNLKIIGKVNKLADSCVRDCSGKPTARHERGLGMESPTPFRGNTQMIKHKKTQSFHIGF